MNSIVTRFVEDLQQNAPKTSKESVISYALNKYSFVQDRKVYRNDYFAVRFNVSKNSFSNTVLYLS